MVAIFTSGMGGVGTSGWGVVPILTGSMDWLLSIWILDFVGDLNFSRNFYDFGPGWAMVIDWVVPEIAGIERIAAAKQIAVLIFIATFPMAGAIVPLDTVQALLGEDTLLVEE